MNAEEVINFWQCYCATERLANDVLDYGTRQIRIDPEYWQVQSMARLRDEAWGAGCSPASRSDD